MDNHRAERGAWEKTSDMCDTSPSFRKPFIRNQRDRQTAEGVEGLTRRGLVQCEDDTRWDREWFHHWQPSISNFVSIFSVSNTVLFLLTFQCHCTKVKIFICAVAVLVGKPISVYNLRFTFSSGRVSECLLITIL